MTCDCNYTDEDYRRLHIAHCRSADQLEAQAKEIAELSGLLSQSREENALIHAEAEAQAKRIAELENHVADAGKMVSASPSPGLRELVEQIDALLDLHRKGALVPPVPGLAIDLLNRAAAALVAASPSPGLRDVLAEFERRTEAVPVGSENVSIGASVYGWRIRHLDEFREIAASLSRPVSEREDGQ